jgi:hypothetical protein
MSCHTIMLSVGKEDNCQYLSWNVICKDLQTWNENVPSMPTSFWTSPIFRNKKEFNSGYMGKEENLF